VTAQAPSSPLVLGRDLVDTVGAVSRTGRLTVVSRLPAGHRLCHHQMTVLTPKDAAMRTTLALDDELLTEAQRLTGMTEKTALVRAALGALIERESARRLARLGGTEPSLADVPRRRTQPR